MTGIVFVLKIGVPWKNLQATSDFPSGHTYRRRLLEWHARGVWYQLWQNILAELQPEGRLSWERPSATSPASGLATAARRPAKAL